ncbi:hypothetical protein B0H14DRAFT_3736988 [Mycena olivaceomarginata]|nr:hypothetical protein B0H14DRAFT_3736988 [Mycena olivaceomarginata]
MSTPHPTLFVSGVQDAKSNPFAGADAHSFAATTSVAFAIIVWEYVTVLPEELRLYRRSVWTTIPPYSFLALRYGGILATLPVLFLSTAENIHCQAAASLTQVGLVLVVTSSGIIFAFRTSLLWSDNWNIRGALSGLVVVVTVCWIAVATQYQAAVVPTPLFGSICRVLATAPWLPLGNAVFTAFLIIALILTLLKIQSHRPRDSPVGHLIYRANLLYLFGTILTAATAFVIQTISPPSSALVLCTGPLTTVFLVAFGTRAFRNMTLATALDTDRTPGLPMPDSPKSSSSSFSDTSEMRFAPHSVPHPPPTRSLPRIVTRSRSIGTPRSPITGPTRPHLRTADPTRPRTGNSSRPHTAGSTATADPFGIGPFPSPPNSYATESVLSASLLSSSVHSTSPLRPSQPDQYYTDQPLPGSASYPSRSPLSDSLHQPRAL